MASDSSQLTLAFDFAFEDLYSRHGLVRLDEVFTSQLQEANAGLFDRLMAARAGETLAPKAASELIIELAPYVEDFIGDLFGISAEIRALQAKHSDAAPLYTIKRQFVQRKALTGMTKERASLIDGPQVLTKLETLFGEPVTEISFALNVSRWLEREADHPTELSLAAQFAAWATLSDEGRAIFRHGIVFRAPHKLDMQHLVPVETIQIGGVSRFRLPEHDWRHREGFALTDPGMDLPHALDQASYCIKCHNQGKDSCSTGLKEKNGAFKQSVFGVTLAGCPLSEKISEMNVLKQKGNTIGALAAVTIDNPMTAGTGHRICNDCMKACVYQKQEPVDIPQIETRTLKDVLDLPWGFEVYSLLTRWNPVNFERPLPRQATGFKVLVAGLGPAGFTLSHHLMNDGHTVVAIDGLKIEPLDPEISGIDLEGRRTPFRPIRDIAELREPLDDRVMAGFGGVAEYGITVRWDKNFLKVIRLLLERRSEFTMYGGVRFGGAITIESAFEMGFDHIALCAGAGKPTVIPMKNGLTKGVRQASDFLMALQLTGAAKTESVANLQIRMPVVVIGGGLTAIDTATESLAYYPLQVEKFLSRYETLVAEKGEREVQQDWSQEDREVAAEFIAHARAIRAERGAAARERRKPDLISLMNSWGGVTLAYRRRLIDSPSYTLNHEEVAKALEEGVQFAECLNPHAVEVDHFGAAVGLELKQLRYEPEMGKMVPTGAGAVLPARSILVAAGTQPNTVLGREDPEHVVLDGRYFQAVDDEGKPVKPERLAKPAAVRVLMSVRPDGRAVSFFGDLHPSFAGNVVKAMGGAKQGYPVVSRMLSRLRVSA
ncbi:MAG: FAD-dependent oxidoreductase, partial [Acidobacteriaceae bacterium]|nr:FAD-dependent oxidoreductase [Acidobacteriaceae bacterium]